MTLRFIWILGWLLCALPGFSQGTSPTKIKYTTWDLHALRHFSFSQSADSLVYASVQRMDKDDAGFPVQETSVSLFLNAEFLNQRVVLSSMSNDLISRLVIKPYQGWLPYLQAVPPHDVMLPAGAFDSASTALFNKAIGYDNMEYYLDEVLKFPNLRSNKTEAALHSIVSPLSPEGFKEYRFFFSSIKEIDSVPCIEIAFFSKDPQRKTFEGYIYLSEKGLSFVKAIYTVNYLMDISPVQEILFTESNSQRGAQLFMGSDRSGAILAERNEKREASPDDPAFIAYEQRLDSLMDAANRTRAYRNANIALSTLLTGHFPIGNFQFGPLQQVFNYNKMEGARIRLGGYTNSHFNRKIRLGGYVAYGFKDEMWKYRGDIAYLPNATDQLQLTYVEDLNLPGYDLLTSTRDNVFRSITLSGTNEMSLQRIFRLGYEKRLNNAFTLKTAIKYVYDEPQGTMQYLLPKEGLPELVPNIVSSEWQLGFRYAPNERFLRFGEKRLNFSSAPIAVEVQHRFGLKGIAGSDYRYHITEADIYKSIKLPDKAGVVELRAGAGKVWSRIPFPLLFGLTGNQTFLYNKEGYNLLDYYEFITDQYISGSLAASFNWSPLNLVLPRTGIHTELGVRSLYGTLSDRNNPAHHSDLFPLTNGISPLGKTPYTEVNIGLSNIFRYLRVDYVYRLNYGRQGGIFFTSSIGF